jgi:hypothetical protein
MIWLMIHLLNMMGLLVVLAVLAASPSLLRLLDEMFPQLRRKGLLVSKRGSTINSGERAELTHEVRRLTTALERRPQRFERDSHT